MNSEHKYMKLMIITSLFLITFRTHQLSETPQNTSLGYGIVFISENHQDTATRGIGCLNLLKNHSEESLTLKNFASFSLKYILKRF